MGTAGDTSKDAMPTTWTTRRNLLKTMAASTLVAGLGRPVAASRENGAVVFVYDDGPIEDYTQAFPVHQSFDAPACVGVVTDWIGRRDHAGPDCMDLDHLAALEDAGWEILSHTVEHTALGQFELVVDVDPDDDRIYPTHNRHGYFRGKALEITDGTSAVERTVTDWGSDGVGQYVELDAPVGEHFAAGETVERYPAHHLHEFLADSKRALEGHGFEVSNLLCPYDSCDEYAAGFIRQHYDGTANANHGSRINDPTTLDPHETRRDYFVEFTDRAPVRRDLDRIAETGAVGVLGAHTFKPEVTPERIRQTLLWVDDRGLDVLTLREAFERYGGESTTNDPQLGHHWIGWPRGRLFDRADRRGFDGAGRNVFDGAGRSVTDRPSRSPPVLRETWIHRWLRRWWGVPGD